MKIKEIVSALERFAPLPLQDGYDNAGMQIGLTDAEATGALLCLDVTEEVIDEAIKLGCNLVISHHPLLFKGLKSITGSSYVEKCVLHAIRNSVAIYSAHTNIDNTKNGVSYKMAEKLELENIRFLDPSTTHFEAGSGIIGTLREPMTELEFLRKLKITFEVECVRHNELNGKLIEKVALCGGAGDFLIDKAVSEEVDAFFTGEIKYHNFFGYEEKLLLAEIGHYESEQYTKEIFYSIIKDLEPNFEVHMCNVNTNPIKYL